MQRKGSEATREPATRERLGRKSSGERGVRLVRLTVEDKCRMVKTTHGFTGYSLFLSKSLVLLEGGGSQTRDFATHGSLTPSRVMLH